MLKDLIRQVADGAGLEEEAAREAVGVVFTTADRQGVPKHLERSRIPPCFLDR